MKLIADIRLFASAALSTEGRFPQELACRTHSVALRRAVLRLREKGFSLGDSDHLYLNFTTALPEDEMCLCGHTDREHPWYRFVDVGATDLAALAEPASLPVILNAAERALSLAVPGDAAHRLVHDAIREAVEQGADMEVPFREKRHAKGRAVVYLRIRDDGLYAPLLRVYRTDGTEALREELPACVELTYLGEMQLSARRVTIRPRRSAWAEAQGLAPLSFCIQL